MHNFHRPPKNHVQPRQIRRTIRKKMTRTILTHRTNQPSPHRHKRRTTRTPTQHATASSTQRQHSRQRQRLHTSLNHHTIHKAHSSSLLHSHHHNLQPNHTNLHQTNLSNTNHQRHLRLLMHNRKQDHHLSHQLNPSPQMHHNHKNNINQLIQLRPQRPTPSKRTTPSDTSNKPVQRNSTHKQRRHHQRLRPSHNTIYANSRTTTNTKRIRRHRIRYSPNNSRNHHPQHLRHTHPTNRKQHRLRTIRTRQLLNRQTQSHQGRTSNQHSNHDNSSLLHLHQFQHNLSHNQKSHRPTTRRTSQRPQFTNSLRSRLPIHHHDHRQYNQDHTQEHTNRFRKTTNLHTTQAQLPINQSPNHPNNEPHPTLNHTSSSLQPSPRLLHSRPQQPTTKEPIRNPSTLPRPMHSRTSRQHHNLTLHQRIPNSRPHQRLRLKRTIHIHSNHTHNLHTTPRPTQTSPPLPNTNLLTNLPTHSHQLPIPLPRSFQRSQTIIPIISPTQHHNMPNMQRTRRPRHGHTSQQSTTRTQHQHNNTNHNPHHSLNISLPISPTQRTNKNQRNSPNQHAKTHTAQLVPNPGTHSEGNTSQSTPFIIISANVKGPLQTQTVTQTTQVTEQIPLNQSIPHNDPPHNRRTLSTLRRFKTHRKLNRRIINTSPLRMMLLNHLLITTSRSRQRILHLQILTRRPRHSRATRTKRRSIRRSRIKQVNRNLLRAALNIRHLSRLTTILNRRLLRSHRRHHQVISRRSPRTIRQFTHHTTPFTSHLQH